jgi:hypothetical protein
VICTSVTPLEPNRLPIWPLKIAVSTTLSLLLCRHSGLRPDGCTQSASLNVERSHPLAAGMVGYSPSRFRNNRCERSPAASKRCKLHRRHVDSAASSVDLSISMITHPAASVGPTC